MNLLAKLFICSYLTVGLIQIQIIEPAFFHPLDNPSSWQIRNKLYQQCIHVKGEEEEDGVTLELQTCAKPADLGRGSQQVWNASWNPDTGLYFLEYNWFYTCGFPQLQMVAAAPNLGGPACPLGPLGLTPEGCSVVTQTYVGEGAVNQHWKIPTGPINDPFDQRPFRIINAENNLCMTAGSPTINGDPIPIIQLTCSPYADVVDQLWTAVEIDNDCNCVGKEYGGCSIEFRAAD